MSDENKTVREHRPRAARSVIWWDRLDQLATACGARLPRNPEIV